MFGKDKHLRVTKTKETRRFNGNIENLKDHSSETARQAYYIYERSDFDQQRFLNNVLSPYIIIRSEVEIEDCLTWDYPEERLLSKEIESFSPPYEIREKVISLYNETVRRNLPTNNERKQMEQQRKIDDGFNNFFKK